MLQLQQDHSTRNKETVILLMLVSETTDLRALIEAASRVKLLQTDRMPKVSKSLETFVHDLLIRI